MNRQTLYYAGLILVSIIWGANFGISKLAMESIHPIVFTALRFLLAAPLFFVILKLTEGKIGIQWKHVPYFIFVAVLGVTLLEILVNYAIIFTTLANSSLLTTAPWPIFAALFSPLFTKEAITKRLVVGGCFSIIGVSFVILGGGEGFNLSSEHMIGNLIALSVSIIGPIFNLSSMSLMKHYSALRVSTWTILFGVLVMLPFTIKHWTFTNWSAISFVEISAIGYAVFMCTVVGFVVWNTSMFKIGATRSNFFRYVVPLTAVIMGYFMFGEKITAMQIAGTLCMAIGLIWITIEKKPAAPLQVENSGDAA